MRRGLRLLGAVAALGGILSSTTARAAIPVDLYETIRLEAEIPALVEAGEPVRISGVFLDTSLTRVTFGFASEAADGAQHDFAFQVQAGGRFERTLTFTAQQQGTYAVHVWSGRPEWDGWPHRGVFQGFVVDGSVDDPRLPRAFFDGLVLDEPLSFRLPLRRPLRIGGRVLDEQVKRVQLQLTHLPTGAERSIDLPRDGERFDGLVRWRSEEAGPMRLRMVTGYRDDTYWWRGDYEAELQDAPTPDVDVGVLSLSLLPGQEAAVPLANRGDGGLQLAAPETEGPFGVIAAPAEIAAGGRDEVRIVYDGDGGDTGTLTIRSDDPLRPIVQVALVGAKAGADATRSWTRLRPDGDDRLRAPVDLDSADYVLALYSARLDPQSVDDVYGFSLGGPAPVARPVAAARPAAGDLAESELRRREAELARRVTEAGLPASRPAAVSYRVGDRRRLVFDDFAGVPRQEVASTVVAVTRFAVGFAHDGTGAAAEQLPAASIQAMLEQFDDDYPMLIDVFGAPSDGDGDGKIAFLFTPLTDSTGAGGFVNSPSMLPESLGGNGNLTDLIYMGLGEHVGAGDAVPRFRPILAHELQHLISFHQHVLVRQGQGEVSWLNEGLSHVAEDLVDGFFDGGNDNRAKLYLADPAAVGLVGDAAWDNAKRGVSYLFVRSLVDRFGVGLLGRLVKTGLAERDNLETATGEPFEELLANFAAQLYLSGSPEADHPRHNFAFDRLSPAGLRGFGVPASLPYDADGAAVDGQLRPRGLSYVRVTGSERRSSSSTPIRGLGCGPFCCPCLSASSRWYISASITSGACCSIPP